MIHPLSLDNINRKAPYKVELDEVTGSFNTKFSLYTTHIIDEEGVPNFAALILRNDNPKIVEVVTEFTQATKVLRDKPTEDSKHSKS